MEVLEGIRLRLRISLGARDKGSRDKRAGVEYTMKSERQGGWGEGYDEEL